MSEAWETKTSPHGTSGMAAKWSANECLPGTWSVKKAALVFAFRFLLEKEKNTSVVWCHSLT